MSTTARTGGCLVSGEEKERGWRRGEARGRGAGKEKVVGLEGVGQDGC